MKIYCESDVGYNDEISKIKEKYKEILSYLKKQTEYIEIVDTKFKRMEKELDKEFLEAILNNLISKKEVKKWEGTEIEGGKYTKLTVKANKEIFNYLNNHKFFWIREKDSILFMDNKTQVDIAFFNKNKKCLLYITTHEGMIGVSGEVERFVLG